MAACALPALHEAANIPPLPAGAGAVIASSLGQWRGCQRDEAHRGADGRRMISSTVLTLLVIPAVYSLWKEWEVHHHRAGVPRTST
jgi:hypothetical protein